MFTQRNTYGIFLLTVVLGVLMAMPTLVNAQAFPWEAKVGGFIVGPQAYTFRLFTFFEAVDKAKASGANAIEAYPGQKLSPDVDASFNHNASPAIWAQAKKKLKDTGVRLVNYGVVNVKNEEEARKLFDFATVMDIPCITTEPPVDQLDMYEKLAEEYQIKVALHNHPKRPDNPDYKWWDPEFVMKSLEGRSPLMGACADTGHWTRSGIKPLDGIKILAGRINSCHIKDLNEFARNAHDVHWGEGVGNVKAVLDELRKQGFEGNISIEYEHNWENNQPDVAACIDFIRAYGANN